MSNQPAPSSSPPATPAPATPLLPTLTPAKLISTYDPGEWEIFIEEWTQGFVPPYTLVDRLGGAGDMGRDVAGYLDDPSKKNCKWDNYQCKHYARSLSPSDIWVELGKVCVHSFRGEYKPPRRYKFVAPMGVTTRLHDLMRKPAHLKEGLIENWASACEDKISEKEKFPLTGKLKTYVKAFDFSTVGYVPLNQVVEQHRRTRFWFLRFKQELPIRPTDESPPAQPTAREAVYVAQLLAAYTEYCKTKIACCDDVLLHPKVIPHFKRSRTYFYAAETLNRFSRDQFELGAFNGVKKQVFDGIVESAEAPQKSAYEKIGKVTETAASIPLAVSSLSPYVTPADKKGICHHLVNDGDIKWVCK